MPKFVRIHQPLQEMKNLYYVTRILISDKGRISQTKQKEINTIQIIDRFMYYHILPKCLKK